jgi:hypothetical protein
VEPEPRRSCSSLRFSTQTAAINFNMWLFLIARIKRKSFYSGRYQIMQSQSIDGVHSSSGSTQTKLILHPSRLSTIPITILLIRCLKCQTLTCHRRCHASQSIGLPRRSVLDSWHYNPVSQHHHWQYHVKELAALALQHYESQIKDSVFIQELTTFFASTYPEVQNLLSQHLKAHLSSHRSQLREVLSQLSDADKMRTYWIVEALLS